MPVDVHYPKLADDAVAFEHLDRNYCGVFHQVAHHFAVEDLQGAVVAGISKERPRAVIFDGADGLGVESHRLVRSAREVHIMPQQAAVVRTNDQVVTARVDIERRDPARARLHHLDELLSLQVVATNHALRGHEKQRTRRMKMSCLR